MFALPSGRPRDLQPALAASCSPTWFTPSASPAWPHGPALAGRIRAACGVA